MKGIGEVAMNGPLPAVANAIADACGIRLCRAPLTPVRVAGGAWKEHHETDLRLNGNETHIDTREDRRVVDLLREDLELTGTKEGCGTGECGACTILVDGESRLSCLMLAAQLEGSRVTTVEGLEETPEGGTCSSAPLSEEGAVQCGFCTPGMEMAAMALLLEEAEPTREGSGRGSPATSAAAPATSRSWMRSNGRPAISVVAGRGNESGPETRLPGRALFPAGAASRGPGNGRRHRPAGQASRRNRAGSPASHPPCQRGRASGDRRYGKRDFHRRRDDFETPDRRPAGRTSCAASRPRGFDNRRSGNKEHGHHRRQYQHRLTGRRFTPPLYLLGAEVELASAEGKRRLPIGEFVTGPGRTGLHNREIITRILLPHGEDFPCRTFEKLGLRRSLAVAVTSFTGMMRLSTDGVVEEARFAWGSVGPTVVRLTGLEAELAGVRLDRYTCPQGSGNRPPGRFSHRRHPRHRRVPERRGRKPAGPFPGGYPWLKPPGCSLSVF